MDRDFPIKARYVIAIWLVPIFYLPGFDYVYEMMGEDKGWHVIAYSFNFQVYFGFSIFLLMIFYKINWLKFLTKPDLQEYPTAFKLTAFIFIFSIAATYALFYPLSFIFPNFVNYWLINIPPILYFYQNGLPLIPNLLSFISLVVLAPIIEEFVFRGILLHRWTNKWGIHCSIVCSSALFGILHPDPIGAFAFGVAMSVLYLKTQTLIVPMVCHALNNFVAWLLTIGYMSYKGSDFLYTIETFRSEWIIGLACGLISFFWTRAYLYGKKREFEWSLPKL